MVSLKESVYQNFIHLDLFNIDSRYNIKEQCDGWASGYIKQLEEQMKRFREASPDPEDHVGEGAYYFPLIMNEVLRFLRGETK